MPLEPWLFCIALYFFDRNVQTCMRVVLCQTKNGLPSLLALSMKSLEDLTSTSSKVVMSYFAFRKGKLCMLARSTCPGTAGADLHQRSSASRLCPSAASWSRRRCRSHSCGSNCADRTCCSTVRPPGTSTSTDQTSRQGDTDSQRTRRSRGLSAETCSGHRGGSCQTGQWHSLAP